MKNKEKRAAWNEKNKERLKAYKKAWYKANKEKCAAKRKVWNEANKDKMIAYKKAWYEANKEKCDAKSKAYRKANKEKFKVYDKEYRKENKEKIKAYREANKEKRKKQFKDWSKSNKDLRNRYYRERNKIKRKTDPIYRFKESLRSRTKNAIKRKGYKKESKTEEMLGASYVIVSKHIERQFKKGMNWDNYGEWHIDHIVPLASASTEEEIFKLCHYRNLQPLWASDNISKGCKIPNVQIQFKI